MICYSVFVYLGHTFKIWLVCSFMSFVCWRKCIAGKFSHSQCASNKMHTNLNYSLDWPKRNLIMKLFIDIQNVRSLASLDRNALNDAPSSACILNFFTLINSEKKNRFKEEIYSAAGPTVPWAYAADLSELHVRIDFTFRWEAEHETKIKSFLSYHISNSTRHNRQVSLHVLNKKTYTYV